MPLALRARAVWKSYAAGVVGCSARIWVLRGASLEVEEGECVAILGARSAGTTTLLHCLAGLRRMDAGTIEHRGRPRLFSATDRSTGPTLMSRPGEIILVDDTMHLAGVSVPPRVVREPAERGATMIIGTRELSSVRHLVDRALLLREGHLTSLPLSSGFRRVAERAVTGAAGASSDLEASRGRPKAVNCRP